MKLRISTLLLAGLSVVSGLLSGCSTTSSAPTAPGVSLSTTSMAFANTQIGTTSSALTVTVTNSGNGTLTVTGATISGGNTFAVSGNTCSSVAPQAQCVISVTFNPVTTGTFTTTLSIADNVTGSPQSVALSGTGVAPALTLSATALTFSATLQGSTSPPMSVTLTNSGTGPMTISSIGLTGNSGGVYAISANSCGTTLAVSASCVVSVTFTPTGGSTYTAAISVADNVVGSPQTVALSGTGTATAPVLTITPASLTFANTLQGVMTAPQTVTLKNTGNAPLTISSVTITGVQASSFIATGNCVGTIVVNGTCNVPVTFMPTGGGTFAASLSIANNASGSPQTVTLTGTGTALAPVTVLSATSLAFPNTVIANASAPLSFTLTNNGNTALTPIAVSIGGTNASSFTVSSNSCGNSLPIGGVCTIGVTFTPSAATALSATLSITDNAANSPQTVALSGTGTAPPAVTVTLGTTVVTAVNFGQNRVNSTSSVTVTVTDTSSTVPATLNGITLSGGNASNFALTGNSCGAVLQPGGSCTFNANFNPTAAQSYTTTITVSDNAVPGTQTVALSGSAVLETTSCSGAKTTSPSQTPPTASYAGTAFTGKVMAGSLPVIGATVQIYAAGQAGNGSAPTAMLGTALTTDSTGSFTVPASFTCPYSNSVLYAVSRGGKAGSTGATNAGIVLASVLGTCNSITSTPKFTINEVTTAAMAWSMQQFMAAGGAMGATATNSAGTTNSSGIVLAAATFSNLVNNLAGTAPGTYFPATGIAPTAKINQAANLLNACTVSSGASSSACTQLYSQTATSAGTPSNTLDAMLNLAKNPGANVASLYTLSAASSAFTPALAAAPGDWTLFVTYGGGGMNSPSAVAIDSTGRVWIASYFSVATLLSNTGSPVFASGVTGNNLFDSYGAAVDVTDQLWVANEESAYSLNTGLGTMTVLKSDGTSPTTYSAGGLNFPISASFDTSGVAWIVDYGNSHTTLLTGNGSPLSGANAYTSGQYVFPVAIATDSKCNAYIANQSSNTVTFTSADGATYGSFAVGSGPSGIAVDGADNIWVANYYGDSVGYVTSAGIVKSGSNGYTGGGLNHPQGIAVDGSGTVWVANYRSAAGQNSTMSELAGATAATPGALLSPSTGWGNDAAMLEPFALAIDASGNLWLTNFGSNTVTEFVGMAAPVKTPLLGPVRVP